MELTFYMFRYLKKQLIDSKIRVGPVKTCFDTYKSTPNVLSKDILYKMDPNSHPYQNLQENRSCNFRKNAPCANTHCFAKKIFVDKFKGVDFK